MSSAAQTLCQTLALTIHRAGLAVQAENLVSALGGGVGAPTLPAKARPESTPRQVAARYYDDALLLALSDQASSLAESLVPLTEHLRWTQTDAYVRSPPHERFLDRYAHATILGGNPSSADIVDASHTAAVGVLLLGTDNQYPHHRHYADEVYVPLTHALWSSGEDYPYVDVEPGATLHHQPLQPHSVHTQDSSLLALYLWTGDTTTSAWLDKAANTP